MRSPISPVLAVFIAISFQTYAQFGACDCSASAGAGTVNFSSLTWTGTGCPTAGSTSYTGNLCVSLANGTNLNFDKSTFTVTGQFKLTNSGNSTFTLPANNYLNVTSNMGDNTNNNVTFTINGTLDVDGTLYGKNSNGFTGTGTVYAGGLNFNQAPTGGTGIDWNVPPGTCVPASAFCTMAMPIRLLNFFASIPEGEKNVLIEWATEKEEDFDHFEIERAGEDARFSKIGEVMGAGYNTNSYQKYFWVDENPLVGQNYYRLKAVDLDGSSETFQVVLVTFSDKRRFSVFPNPSNGRDMKYRINFEYTSGDKIVLFDKLGKEIQTSTVSDVEANLPFSEEMKPGIYLLKYTSTSFNEVVKIIIR